MSACCSLLNVRPITSTLKFSIARRAVAPQPQPMSSNFMRVVAGVVVAAALLDSALRGKSHFPSDRSIFASCASCSDISGRAKYAQL